MREERNQRMSDKGLLVVISGFSGVGKGTIVRKLLDDYNERYYLSISATTRNPRPGEEHGREYFFITQDEFDRMISENRFLEYARYVGNSYGTPVSLVEDNLNAGKDVILEIELQGAMQVKEIYPDALTVFVVPPDAETLKNRLVGRGTETEEVICERLKRAGEEADQVEWYEYIIVNDKLETSVASLHGLIQSTKNRTLNNIEFINEVKEGVKAFSKGE